MDCCEPSVEWCACNWEIASIMMSTHLKVSGWSERNPVRKLLFPMNPSSHPELAFWPQTSVKDTIDYMNLFVTRSSLVIHEQHILWSLKRFRDPGGDVPECLCLLIGWFPDCGVIPLCPVSIEPWVYWYLETVLADWLCWPLLKQEYGVSKGKGCPIAYFWKISSTSCVLNHGPSATVTSALTTRPQCLSVIRFIYAVYPMSDIRTVLGSVIIVSISQQQQYQ